MENASFRQESLCVLVEVNAILCALMEEETVILDVLVAAGAVEKKFFFLGVERVNIFFEWVGSIVFEKMIACEGMVICAFEEMGIGAA